MAMRRAGGLLTVTMAVAVMAVGANACTGTAGSSASSASGPALPSSPMALPAVNLDQFRGMLDGLHGSPVLLNVWASWCGPCVQEAPALESLAAEFRGKVRFVGLDVLDTASNARSFVTRYRWTFPSVADPKGEVRNGLGFVGQPVTVVYDGTGKQVFAQSGPITEAQIRQALATVA